MPRKKPTNFRAHLEPLEPRTLMAADLAASLRISDFLASSHSNVAQPAVAPSEASTMTIYNLSRFLGQPSSQTTGQSTPATVGPLVQTTTTTTTAAAPAPKTSDWFDLNVTDVTLRSLVRQNVANDKLINRTEMLGIFSQVGKDGVVSAAEFADLKRVVGNSTYFVGLDYVSVLASDVVNGNVANARYLGGSLGNLAAGSSATQLGKLVDKWFFGKDHPIVAGGYGLTYQKAAGSLFPHAPTYSDVKQGIVGDCYFLASIGEAALVDPKLITNMFIVNGDSTYTVRFYNKGKAEYVTVDSLLPATAAGTYLYANLGGNIRNAAMPLWVALAEKAYAQMNESGWLRASLGDRGHNSYDAISGGYMFEALNQTTNKRVSYHAVDQATFVNLYNSHQLITFGSLSRPADKSVVGGHAYAVLSYNANTQQVTLFNPWGINNGSAPGTVTLTWAQMKKDFGDMQYTV